jgi:hypothetical protein
MLEFLRRFTETMAQFDSDTASPHVWEHLPALMEEARALLQAVEG